MDKEWVNHNLVRRWANANGSVTHPFGDYWRMTLVNPLVLRAAKGIALQLSQTPESLPLDVDLAFSVAALRATRSGERDKLIGWHREMQRSRDNVSKLTGLRIMDLGCGEGYLGRWLCPMGVSYRGFDGSRPLLGVAKKRLGGMTWSIKKAKRSRSETINDFLQYFLADLDGDAFKQQGRDEIQSVFSTWGIPHLTLGVILLEHLNDPLPLMKWLGQALSREARQSWILVITLNPDYFEENGDLALSFDGYQKNLTEISHRKAKIASAAAEVEVYFRKSQRLDRLFRDSRLQIVRCAPLRFPLGFARHEEETAVRGIAPFFYYLLNPLPSASPATEVLEDLLSGNRIAGLLAWLHEGQKAFLRAHAAALEVITFARDDVILRQHNLGGDIYVVIQGSAELRMKGEPQRVFRPGELFGDLETSTKERESRYPLPVIAAKEPARVLRVPAAIFEELLKADQFAGRFLFEQLRDRLIVDFWTYVFREDSRQAGQESPREKKVLMTKERATSFGLPAKDTEFAMNWRNVDRIARVLLAAADEERQRGDRAADGRSIFLSTDRLLEKTRLDLRATTEILVALRLLTWLGIVDSFPGKFVRKYSKEDYTLAWDHLKTAAAKAFLLPIFAKAKLERQFASLTTGVGLGAGRRMWKEKWVPAVDVHRAAMELAGIVKDSSLLPIWKVAVRNWFEYIWSVNQFWYDGAPSFFYLQDPSLLRALTLEQDSIINDLLIARYLEEEGLTQSPGETFEVLAQNMFEKEPGRLRLFLIRAQQFFLADLPVSYGEECHRGIRFSGMLDGYPIPDWNEGDPFA